MYPLAKFFLHKDIENATVIVEVADRRGYVSVAMATVDVRPFDSDYPSLAQWEFYEDGTAIPKDCGDDDQVDWSTAATEIVRVCHEQMCKEIKRVDERVKPALARLELAFPLLCAVPEI